MPVITLLIAAGAALDLENEKGLTAVVALCSNKFAPREQQQQPYPQPREQPQPREYREPRENRQPQMQPQETGAAGLPSFITGGAQPGAGFESNGNGAPQGERFAHRRRRPRGPRPEGQAPVQESGDVASE